jgi:uncharacterized small protein (DUF1192 family)
MMSILQRIQQIADNESITVGFLEKKIGASKGVLSRAINKGTDIQSKWLQVIVENYPLYSSTWLLTGKGEMLQNTPNLVHEAPIRQSDISEKSLIYQLFKDKDAEVGALKEEIGRLKAELEGLKIENKELIEILKSIPKHAPVSSVEIA